jgi:phosphoglycerate dehydrogenase-like enzyme
MMLILAAARHVTTFTEEVKGGVWRLHPGVEIRGKTLAVIGFGGIGRRVAQIASDGFHMKVTSAGRSDDYRSAVSDADFVSLHISATPDNKHFMNRDRLAMIRKDAWLINTARGYVVDENALYDTLAARRIAGAALDVYEREPYQPIEPERDLRPLPNTILTPHAASSTSEASRRMAERALQNLRLAEGGDFGAMDLLNPEVLAKLR